MPSVNFTRTYPLQDDYPAIKGQAQKHLQKYLDYPGLFAFVNAERRVTFKSEQLIPVRFTQRPRVMLLFSNPHPHSVHQGMFLSPNTRGRENPFWSILRKAGWLNFMEEVHHPQQIAERCFNADYQSPFDFIFYAYYAFPTDYPQHIEKIFGKSYFKQVIVPEAYREFRATLIKTGVQAVVTFNVEVFNLVSQEQIEEGIKKLVNGELIQSTVSDVDGDIPIFYTFPTGWRFHQDYARLRTSSLAQIKNAIMG